MSAKKRPTIQSQKLQDQDVVGRCLTLDEVCEQYVDYILERCGGHRRTAARVLGVGLSTVYRWDKNPARRTPEATLQGLLTLLDRWDIARPTPKTL
jgi:hypothetical protein